MVPRARGSGPFTARREPRPAWPSSAIRLGAVADAIRDSPTTLTLSPAGSTRAISSPSPLWAAPCRPATYPLPISTPWSHARHPPSSSCSAMAWPRGKKAIVAALAGRHGKGEVVRTLIHLAVTGQVIDADHKYSLAPATQTRPGLRRERVLPATAPEGSWTLPAAGRSITSLAGSPGTSADAIGDRLCLSTAQAIPLIRSINLPVHVIS